MSYIISYKNRSEANCFLQEPSCSALFNFRKGAAVLVHRLEKNPWGLGKGMYSVCWFYVNDVVTWWKNWKGSFVIQGIVSKCHEFGFGWSGLQKQVCIADSYSSSSPNPVSRLRNEGADNCKKHLSCTWRIDSILADKLAEKHICFKTRQNNTKLQSIKAGGFGSAGGRCN